MESSLQIHTLQLEIYNSKCLCPRGKETCKNFDFKTIKHAHTPLLICTCICWHTLGQHISLWTTIIHIAFTKYPVSWLLFYITSNVIMVLVFNITFWELCNHFYYSQYYLRCWCPLRRKGGEGSKVNYQMRFRNCKTFNRCSILETSASGELHTKKIKWIYFRP